MAGYGDGNGDDARKGNCTLDGIRLKDHPKCEAPTCGILVGRKHVFKELTEVRWEEKRLLVCPQCAKEGPLPTKCKKLCINGNHCILVEDHHPPCVCLIRGCPCPNKRILPIIVDPGTKKKKIRK